MGSVVVVIANVRDQLLHVGVKHVPARVRQQAELRMRVAVVFERPFDCSNLLGCEFNPLHLRSLHKSSWEDCSASAMMPVAVSLMPRHCKSRSAYTITRRVASRSARVFRSARSSSHCVAATKAMTAHIIKVMSIWVTSQSWGASAPPLHCGRFRQCRGGARLEVIS